MKFYANLCSQILAPFKIIAPSTIVRSSADVEDIITEAVKAVGQGQTEKHYGNLPRAMLSYVNLVQSNLS